jgi:signal transduction histidine kinase
VEMAVHAVLPLVQPMLDAKQIRLEIAPCEGVVMARADGDRLRQILLNLVSNAAKYTEASGAIDLRWRRGDEIEICVHDNGTGIPADQINRIFEPFVQLETAQAHVGSGFGLGLAISRGLARAMGGELVASSESGRGSTFTLRLPKAT